MRELRYAPLDRHIAAQMLNSFVTEMAAGPAEGDAASTSGSGAPPAYACSAASIASLIWALSFTKHKRKFVGANRGSLLAVARAADARWAEMDPRSLLHVATGFAALRLLPSPAWLSRLYRATRHAATAGALTSEQAVGLGGALRTLQALVPEDREKGGGPAA